MRPEWDFDVWLVTHVDSHRTPEGTGVACLFLKKSGKEGKCDANPEYAWGLCRMLVFRPWLAGSFSLGALSANLISLRR